MMSSTLEHAISDDAAATHEQGHAVATALQRALKGSSVEFGFPGIVTAHLASGAVARCGGPAFGWVVVTVRTPRARALPLRGPLCYVTPAAHQIRERCVRLM